ncbi:MAG: SCO1664 family protein [Candidatus Limnocylindrales bacterium]
MAGRQVAGSIDRQAALRVLREGEMTVVGRLLSASNATFFCVVEERLPDGRPGVIASCVYKPTRGERPLSDFPDGTLARREVAAHAVAVATGWDLIPPTVLRDGAFGQGMVQLWVEVDESADLAEIVDEERPALRRIALLDVVLNNADRKGGHLLPLPDGRILGIDNGLCFAVEPKLRTILWRWRGQPLDDEELAILVRLRADLRGALGEELRRLLEPTEVRATARRIDALLTHPRFPLPDPNRPAIPWPPY